MSVYAIGDVQGCFNELQTLLDRLDFSPARDTLWFVGDLVNRGPHSLEVLRFVKGLGERAVTVLGNHDLHLLAVWQRHPRHLKPKDTLGPIFDADDGDELLHWLRRQPLFHVDETLGFAMVHAGLPPQWDLTTARQRAAEVEDVLRSDDFAEFFTHMYGDQPNHWDDELAGWDRLRFIVNCFTRLRYCSRGGTLDLEAKGRPGSQPEGYLPWFTVPDRHSAVSRVVFGHWSTLGLQREENAFAIDTGCLWGGSLSALRLDHPDLPVIQLDCPGVRRPGH